MWVGSRLGWIRRTRRRWRGARGSCTGLLGADIGGCRSPGRDSEECRCQIGGTSAEDWSSWEMYDLTPMQAADMERSFKNGTICPPTLSD